MRFAQVDHNRVVIGGVDAGHRREHRFERVVGLRGLERELHIGGGDCFTIVEDGVLHEVKGHGETVVGDVPALGQVRLRLEVLVEQQRRGVQLRAGYRSRVARLNGAIEMTRHLRALDQQRATSHRAGVNCA